MTTLLDEPATTHASVAPANRLRDSMAAMRLSFTWFGIRKSLTTEQKAEAAEAFGAEGDALSAGKRLINTKHVQYKAVTSIRSQATALWKSYSLPFPEPGIRLVRRDDVGTLNMQMTTLRGELSEAVAELDDHFVELKAAARERLGRLFNEADYPATLNGLFDMGWDWPSVEPPEYLSRLSPALYQEECRRVQARFDEAVQLAEQAFMEELAKLVERLTERLTYQPGDHPKVFRDSAITNFTEFFERFRTLNIRSNEQLDELVSQAQDVIRGVQPQTLRDNDSLRLHVAEQLGSVGNVLDELLTDRPRRNILRRPR